MCFIKIKTVIPEEMEARRNASGCRFGATGSYGDESSMSPPETTARVTKIHHHLSGRHDFRAEQSISRKNKKETGMRSSSNKNTQEQNGNSVHVPNGNNELWNECFGLNVTLLWCNFPVLDWLTKNWLLLWAVSYFFFSHGKQDVHYDRNISFWRECLFLLWFDLGEQLKD